MIDHLHPYAEHRCEVCGEKLGTEDDIGEMHGEPVNLYGARSNGLTSSGRVHAQCGRDVGWEVS